MGSSRVIRRPGYQRLWGWFGLSRAAWLVLPRVCMHDMPDEWQRKMAVLLEEWDARWDWPEDTPSPTVVARRDNRFARWPEWLVMYRHPDTKQLQRIKARRVRK